jgi:hypothetical protein
MSGARAKFTKFIFFVVLLLGVLSITLLLGDPPPETTATTDGTQQPSALFDLNNPVLAKLRALASVTAAEPAEKANTAADILKSVFDFDCEKEGLSFETKLNKFRVKSEKCPVGEDGSPLNTQIRNKTNNFVATVFHKSAGAFTTDFINLAPGNNEVEVEFETTQGVVKKTFTVVRVAQTAKK